MTCTNARSCGWIQVHADLEAEQWKVQEKHEAALARLYQRRAGIIAGSTPLTAPDAAPFTPRFPKPSEAATDAEATDAPMRRFWYQTIVNADAGLEKLFEDADMSLVEAIT